MFSRHDGSEMRHQQLNERSRVLKRLLRVFPSRSRIATARLEQYASRVCAFGERVQTTAAHVRRVSVCMQLLAMRLRSLWGRVQQSTW